MTLTHGAGPELSDAPLPGTRSDGGFGQQRRQLQGWSIPCNCTPAEMMWGLKHIGSHDLSYPP